MYTINALEDAIRALYLEGTVEDDYSKDEVEAMLDSIDFPMLLQTVRHEATTAYAFRTMSCIPDTFTYRGADLFRQRATLLFTGDEQTRRKDVPTTHGYELWLLEDMSIQAVVCVTLDCNGGSYSGQYREVKGNPWFSGMVLDLEDLTESLNASCDYCRKNCIPMYEL